MENPTDISLLEPVRRPTRELTIAQILIQDLEQDARRIATDLDDLLSKITARMREVRLFSCTMTDASKGDEFDGCDDGDSQKCSQ